MSTVLSKATWQAHQAAHLERAQRFTAPYRARRSRREAHPVDDFLFTYYSYSLGKLETWHPGIDVRLEADSPLSRFDRCVDGESFLHPEDIAPKKREALRFIHNLLQLTASRAGNFGCFGVHEWAMVYRGQEVRHEATTALRLAQRDIDTFVESRNIRCSHYDAFRFFAPEAKPMNQLQPDLWTREEHEQPACLHANMDLYKWAYKSMPWVGSDLLMDCFELALEIRMLDMQASPYDLAPYGILPVKIETSEGRKAYETRQRQLAAKATKLRQLLTRRLGEILSPVPA